MSGGTAPALVHCAASEIARPARIARVATETSEMLSLGVRDVVDALRHRARKTLDPAVVEHLASASKAVITQATSGDPRVQVLDAEPSPVVQIGEADLPRIARAFGELADLKNPFTHGHATMSPGSHLRQPTASAWIVERPRVSRSQRISMTSVV